MKPLQFLQLQHMIISYSLRFAFVHIHKCAGTSIASGFGRIWIPTISAVTMDDWGSTSRLGENNLHKHSPASELRDAIGTPIWNELFTFAFVRHPLDRLVSFYEFMRRVHDRNQPKTFWSTVLKRNRPRRADIDSYPDSEPWTWPGMRAFIGSQSFSEFIHSPELELEQGIWPQYRFVTGEGDDSIVDFVAQVENIESAWHIITDRIGVTAELRIENKSERRFQAIRHYYSDEDLNWASHQYRRDFEMFGYSIDL
ncbi:MAG: sulfotransferase family 2 domain-containing protein [Pirellulaceae bacterium]